MSIRAVLTIDKQESVFTVDQKSSSVEERLDEALVGLRKVQEDTMKAINAVLAQQGAPISADSDDDLLEEKEEEDEAESDATPTKGPSKKAKKI
eukprot:TRINITY_DN933_c0_g1_i1.p2 TRINITY_DN933_c0_g1~~TRINITY_DN933_c0_g1_i1.p2  ORF type:complete len:94 (-),score=14.47 TRINITY_DN933_c0_g1_i1:111-392(-)